MAPDAHGAGRQRTLEVHKPPAVILVRKSRGRVTWVSVTRMFGVGASVNVESKLESNEHVVCIDTTSRGRRRVLESLVVAGLIGVLSAAVAGFELEWVILLAIAGSAGHAVYEIIRRARREERVLREGCEVAPGPLLSFVVEEVLRDAARVYRLGSRRWMATIAGLPYEASAYRGRLGFVVTYKRLSGTAGSLGWQGRQPGKTG